MAVRGYYELLGASGTRGVLGGSIAPGGEWWRRKFKS